MNRNLNIIAACILGLLVVGSCTEDSPTSGPTPKVCDANVSAVSSNGLVITGAGFTESEIHLDSTLNSNIFRHLGQENNSFEYGLGGLYRVGAADSLNLSFTLYFTGGNGTRGWDNLAAGNGTQGLVLAITEGPHTGVYRATEGSTTITQFFEDFDNDTLSFTGTYCGTLRDSLDRTITVEGGRFTYTN